MNLPRLRIVGVGIKARSHVSLESLSYIESAHQVYYIVSDAGTAVWIKELNPSAISLGRFFQREKHRYESYKEVVDTVIEALNENPTVCVVFYGHPGVFAYPGRAMIQAAEEKNISAIMAPGISSTDCLFSDLLIDPAVQGCQLFEATDFLVYDRQPDTQSSLILYQIGMIGKMDHVDSNSTRNVDVLCEVLEKYYGERHIVTVYEASQDLFSTPRIEHTALRDLSSLSITMHSTLYVPPISSQKENWDMINRLGMEQARPFSNLVEEKSDIVDRNNAADFESSIFAQ